MQGIRDAGPARDPGDLQVLNVVTCGWRCVGSHDGHRRLRAWLLFGVPALFHRLTEHVDQLPDRFIPERGFHRVVRRFRRAPGLLIAVTMTLFSIGGAIFGMSEEVIPFVLLLLPLIGTEFLPPLEEGAIAIKTASNRAVARQKPTT